MRHSVLSSLALLTLAFSCAGMAPAVGSDHALIERRRIVIVRTGKLARDFPERRRAVVNYPIIRGLPAPVLRKVRSALEIKNVFDTSLAEYREDAWLEEFNYKVNYNRSYILDITFTQSGVGAYPDSQSRHFAFDLRTGEVLKAADAFRADSLARLVELVNSRLRAEVRKKVVEVRGSGDADSNEKGLIEQSLEGLTFKQENLDEFEVGGGGITFLYDAGFPHAIQAAQPAGRYFFTYAQLSNFIRSDGPLGRFAR